MSCACVGDSAFKAQVPPLLSGPHAGTEQDSVGIEAFSADLFLVLVPIHPLGFTKRTLPERQGRLHRPHPSFVLSLPETAPPSMMRIRARPERVE